MVPSRGFRSGRGGGSRVERLGRDIITDEVNTSTEKGRHGANPQQFELRRYVIGKKTPRVRP